MNGDLSRARQLVRLRVISFDAAMRALGEATVALRSAETMAEVALARRDACAAGLAGTRAALVERPQDAAAGLARIAQAADQLAVAEVQVEAAEEQRRAAEDAVIAARVAARRANARRDAMSGQANRLRLADLRQREEREAVEGEDAARTVQ